MNWITLTSLDAGSIAEWRRHDGPPAATPPAAASSAATADRLHVHFAAFTAMSMTVIAVAAGFAVLY